MGPIKDFLEVLQLLSDTPIPNLFAILGAVLLVFAIFGKISTIIELNPKRQILAGVVGTILLCLGVSLYLIPVVTASKQVSIPPTATPQVVPTQAGIIAPTNTAASTAITAPPINIATTIPTTAPSGLYICGEPAFNGNLKTTDPLFLRPDGYLSGWISSDPSTVVLPDGTTKVFATQYVLIVEDFPSVQVKGVQRQAGKANTGGCWYSADLTSFIAEDAKTDFCKKKAGGNVAVFYKLSASGFQQIDTTASVSCP